MNHYLLTVILLTRSNVFMTFAWYGHLKNLSDRPWIIAALVSWGIALFEYLLQVPANRIGHQVMNVGQLKILQEIITLSLFVPFAVFYLKENRLSLGGLVPLRRRLFPVPRKVVCGVREETLPQ
jgi:uncharacterized protein (DUF486 family)